MFLDIAPPNCLINFSESIHLTAKHTITQANDLLRGFCMSNRPAPAWAVGVQLCPCPPYSGSVWQPGPPPQMTFPEEEGLRGSTADGMPVEGHQPVGFAFTHRFLIAMC